jgi:hypothetical protein
MASDKSVRENTEAVNNLAEVMTKLGIVAAELNKNLAALAENQAPTELHGQCHDYRCSNREMHNHGVGCGSQCPCKRVTRTQTVEGAQ